jgi:[ribosomal protein S5]-alanine N-acetyltransferase
MASRLPVLTTERLLLRPFEPGDATVVRALAGHPDVARTTLNIPHPYPEGAAEAWIATHAGNAATGLGYTWAMVRHTDGLLMGSISLMVTAAHRRAEMGYWLGVPYWNQGYTTEAARRVVAFGLDEVGLHRVQATCLPRNVASARVMEKAGLRFEGLLRGYIQKQDRFEDIAIYGLVRHERADDRAEDR